MPRRSILSSARNTSEAARGGESGLVGGCGERSLGVGMENPQPAGGAEPTSRETLAGTADEPPSDSGCPTLESRAIAPVSETVTSEEEPPPKPRGKRGAPVQWRPCVNPGNPVFSCMLESKTLTTSNFLTKPRSLLFKTTSSEYGEIPPTSQMVPFHFFPKDNAFTTHLNICGIMQNNCLNTGIDRDTMYDYTGLM